MLLLHPPAAEHRHRRAALDRRPGPEQEIADRHPHHVIETGVVLTGAQLGDVGLGGVVDHRLLKALDLEHLHLDHVMPSVLVEAFDVDQRQLELLDGHVLRGGEVFEVDDPVVARELQKSVEELDEKRLMSLSAEDAFEDELFLGSANTGRTEAFYRKRGDRAGSQFARLSRSLASRALALDSRRGAPTGQTGRETSAQG